MAFSSEVTSVSVKKRVKTGLRTPLGVLLVPLMVTIPPQ